MYNNVLLVYFSGTGGTRRAADTFEKQLIERSCEVSKYDLDISTCNKNKENISEALLKSQLVILLFAVHAVDAPEPVFRWIEQIEGVGKKAAVISVSGGGETWPNYGCRNNCITALEDKGFEVIYEKMLIMPCNWVFSINDDVAVRLLKILPGKVEEILDNIFSGNTNCVHYKKGAFSKWLSKSEKKHTYEFAEKLKINSNCSGCGWCARSCPMENITIKEGIPAFDKKCIICFRCIYGCPNKAIETKNFMVIKKGFNIKEVEKRMEGKEPAPVEKCARGLLWKGIRNYLKE